MERETKEDFGKELIVKFTNWAMHTNGSPYSDENKKCAIEKFNLTEHEFHCLLFMTNQSWMW